MGEGEREWSELKVLHSECWRMRALSVYDREYNYLAVVNIGGHKYGCS